MDISTDALPDDIEAILNKAGIKNKPVGKKFGSILAIVDTYPIEITTFRQEGRYSDKRHPDQVEFIKDYLNDAKRRDFTINALYLDPLKRELYDPANGLKDMKGKLLRFVGDPKKRIDEDALRMLRGVRLATQLGFKLEKNSFAAIKTRAKYIQSVSGERVRAELDKILISKDRAEGLRLLDKAGLLKFIIPEFEKLKKLVHDATTYHLEGDVATHIIKAVEILQTDNLALIYATLFHDVGKVIERTGKLVGDKWIMTFTGHHMLSADIFRKFAVKFKLTKDLTKTTEDLIIAHDARGKFRKFDYEKQVSFMLAQNNPELLMELWRVDSGANLRIENGKKMWGKSEAIKIGKDILKKITIVKPLFELASGDLIMKYGKLKPGKQLGQKIEDVKVQIVLGKIKNEKDLKIYLSNT